MNRRRSLAELRRRLALLPDCDVFALTRAGLDPALVVERVEHLVESRPPVRLERPAGQRLSRYTRLRPTASE